MKSFPLFLTATGFAHERSSMLRLSATSTIFGERVHVEQSRVGKVLSSWIILPPMEGPSSSIVTWTPHEASSRAAVMPAIPPPTTRTFFFAHDPFTVSMQLVSQFVHVGNDPEVGVLEDGRLRVLVDGDDAVGILHACDVLESPADSHGQIDLRLYRLAGGADLPLLGKPQLVDHRPGAREHGP